MARWFAIVVAVLVITIVVAVGTARACECVDYVLRSMRAAHLHLKTVPNIGVNEWSGHPGSYARSVVNVADIGNCAVLFHEFVHHWQWERAGDAHDVHEWWRRELEADALTARALRGNPCN